MKAFTDMMGRSVNVSFPPQRIISVVPSQTELLYHLGLGERVSGITKFCVHPQEWHRNKVQVGGTKKLQIGKIIDLNPDLIIANKEENTQAEIELLAQHFPVWISDIHTVDEGLQMITELGAVVGEDEEAAQLALEIRDGFNALPGSSQSLRVAYLIWRNPWMTIGKDTFIHDMVCRMGWQNVYDFKTRYPETDLEELRELNPDCIFLSSEPYPFRENHISELQSHLPGTKILLVDGEMFSWYGSRMKQAATYLHGLLHQLT